MGMDIHIKLMRNSDGKIISDNLYSGRCREWFDNLLGKAEENSVYSFLDEKMHDGLPKNCQEDIQELKEKWCFGFRYINLQDYVEWYYEKKPHVDAGWITVREAWLMDTKGIKPDNFLYDLDKDDNPANYEFREIINEYCCDTAVRQAAWDAMPIDDLSKNYTIYFYFDN